MKSKVQTDEAKQQEALRRLIEEIDRHLFQARHFFEPRDLLFIDRHKWNSFKRKVGIRNDTRKLDR